MGVNAVLPRRSRRGPASPLRADSEEVPLKLVGLEVTGLWYLDRVTQ